MSEIGPTIQPRTAIRLRKMLQGDRPPVAWPQGFALRTLQSADAASLHALLLECFDDGADGPYEEWWPKLSGDPEFDPGLVFLIHDATGRLAAAALCWSSDFLRDLAVHPQHRRLGLGDALMRHVFAVFGARGAPHVDLKTEPADSPAAVRLYRRLGMVEVDWEG